MELLAHAQELHTQSTSGFEHFLTQPIIINIVFLIGIAILGYVMQNVYFVAPKLRAVALIIYLIVAAIVSFKYSSQLSAISVSLAALCLGLLTLIILIPIPQTGKTAKK